MISNANKKSRTNELISDDDDDFCTRQNPELPKGKWLEAEEDYQLLIRLRFVTVIEATIFELLLVVAITSFWRASFCSSFFIYNLYTTQLSNLSICRWLPYQMGRLLDSFICVALPVNKNEKVSKNGFKKLADDFPSGEENRLICRQK